MGFWDSLGSKLSNANDSGTTSTGESTGKVFDTVASLVAPEKVRTQISGLFSGGVSSVAKSFLTGKTPGVNVQSISGGAGAGGSLTAMNKDWRIRISLPPKSALHYDATNPFLNILSNTDGVVFPYTPSVSVTHNARYQEQALTHSNYKNYFYEGSDVAAITIQGEFTVQNKYDALYVLASIYFFRSCTKMFFGDHDTNAGNPPPIVYLDGYGDYYFPHVSCIVTSFQHTMPADVDYIEVAYSQGADTKAFSTTYIGNSGVQTARVPTISTFSVTLQPIYSRKNIANNMSLADFSKGGLLKNRGGFL